jgi:ABC-type uncharacterized transport system substrate-binding protein
MRSLNLFLSLSLAGPLAAQDFTPLVQATRTVFPAKHHIGVVCDYTWSQQAVEALANALGGEDRITVVDIRTADHAGRARTVLQNVGAEVLVLLPHDRYVRDGSFAASVLARNLRDQIPTVGTSPIALENGAAFAIGADTRHELLVNPNLRGIIGPVQGGSSAGGPARRASVRIIGLE